MGRAKYKTEKKKLKVWERKYKKEKRMRVLIYIPIYVYKHEGSCYIAGVGPEKREGVRELVFKGHWALKSDMMAVGSRLNEVRRIKKKSVYIYYI